MIIVLIRELLSHYLNVCDHNPPTLQTDGQTAIPRRSIARQKHKTRSVKRHRKICELYTLNYKYYL